MSDDQPPEPPAQTEDLDSFARMVAWLRVTIGYSADEDDAANDMLLADQARRWTSRSIMIATALLAVFNAHSLVSWASTLPPDWGSGTLRELLRVWDSRLGEIGLDRLVKAIHEGYETLKLLRWR